MKPTRMALRRFLKEVDGDFSPALSERVDLDVFADKLLKNANFFYDESDRGNIKCLVAMYANDFEKKYAYIPLVAVASNYRKQGLGSKMMLKALDYIHSLGDGIKIIGIHTNNPIAFELYKKLSFHEVCVCDDNKYYLEYHIK